MLVLSEQLNSLFKETMRDLHPSLKVELVDFKVKFSLADTQIRKHEVLQHIIYKFKCDIFRMSLTEPLESGTIAFNLSEITSTPALKRYRKLNKMERNILFDRYSIAIKTLEQYIDRIHSLLKDIDLLHSNIIRINDEDAMLILEDKRLRVYLQNDMRQNAFSIEIHHKHIESVAIVIHTRTYYRQTYTNIEYPGLINANEDEKQAAEELFEYVSRYSTQKFILGYIRKYIRDISELNEEIVVIDDKITALYNDIKMDIGKAVGSTLK